MASGSAEIGAGNSRYVGNAGIGGGSFGSFQLDVRPIEDLAKYTMLYNRAEYEQAQKDAEKAAAEIADYTSYDLTTGIPKDAKLLQEKYDKLTAYVRDNPNALDYRNKKEWAEYKKMRNDLENDLVGGKVRNTMWALRQKEIQDAKSPAEKVRLQKRLDAEIAETDIRTPLKYSDQYNVQPISVSAAPIKKVQVTEIGKNIIGQDNWEMPDMDAVTNQSIAVTSGLMALADFEKTSEFLSKTPEQQQFYRDQFEAQSASGKLEPVQSAQIFNQAIDKAGSGNFYKDDGTGKMVLDFDKLVESENSIIRGMAEQVAIYNRKMDEMVSGIEGGYFQDDFGGQLSFSNDASGLKKGSYKKINLDDGLSPQELVKMRILGISKAPEREIKITETDDALQAAQLAEQRRHNKATEGIQWGALKLNQDQFDQEKTKWNATMKGGETVKNGAMEFAKRLYADMQKLSDANGIISPDKVRQLNQEQLKYLGAERVTSSNSGAASSTYTPLEIPKGAAIQLINGEVKILLDAKPIPGGTYEGLWDNTKSTNIFNIGTNRLNEQLKNAGAKELNTYMPIDLGTGGMNTNNVGGSTTVGGSTGGSRWDRYKIQK